MGGGRGNGEKEERWKRGKEEEKGATLLLYALAMEFVLEFRSTET